MNCLGFVGIHFSKCIIAFEWQTPVVVTTIYAKSVTASGVKDAGKGGQALNTLEHREYVGG